MQTSVITVGAVFAAIAFTTGAALGADRAITPTPDMGPEGSREWVGRLLTLQEYLEHGERALATPGLSSPALARSDATRPGASDGIRGADGAEGLGRPDATALREAEMQRERAIAQRGSNRDPQSLDAPSGTTLVLLVAPRDTQPTPPPRARTRTSTFSQIPEVQITPTPGSPPVATSVATEGQPYLLVFGDNALSQSTYLKGLSMLTRPNPNWATSTGGSADRLPVRASDGTIAAAPRDPTRPLPTGGTSVASPSGLQDPLASGAPERAEVRVTGTVLSRAGIQAIQVSDLDLVDGPPTTK